MLGLDWRWDKDTTVASALFGSISESVWNLYHTDTDQLIATLSVAEPGRPWHFSVEGYGSVLRPEDPDHKYWSVQLRKIFVEQVVKNTISAHVAVCNIVWFKDEP